MKYQFSVDNETFARYWLDVRYRMRERGFLRGLRFAVGRAGWDDFFSSTHLLLFAQAVRDEPVTVQPDVPITYRFATEQDIPLFSHLYEWPSTLHDHAVLLRNGARSILALDGERLVGHVAGTILNATLTSVRVIGPAIGQAVPVVPGEDAYLEAAYVHPEYRGKHIATLLTLHLLADLYAQGVRRSFMIARADNTPSIQTLKGMGGQVVGELWIHRLAALALIRVQGIES